MDNGATNQNFQFPAVSHKDSAKIASKLSAGGIITKEVYQASTSNMVENPLYNIVFNNLDFYKTMYLHIGWNLTFSQEGQFFYLSKLADGEISLEGDTSSMRVCIPLFYMANSMVRRGYDCDVLWSVNSGMTQDDIQDLMAQEKESIALDSIGFKKANVWQDAIKHLTAKGFLFENTKGNIVFSSAARYFVELMREKFAD